MQRELNTRHKRDGRIWFSAPGAKHYANRFFSNTPYSFVNVSVTGGECACHCEHCNARLLSSMMPISTPEAFCRSIDKLIARGCRGILVSGGSDNRGEVPLAAFYEALGYARKRGLKVLVHTGLIQPETAVRLKEAGVDQILLDVIGHERTIRDVYHLERTPADYRQAMLTCRWAGLDFAPHIVIGLHFGKILGEYEALRMIQEAGPRTIVLVILTPAAGTGMSSVNPPPLSEVGNIIAAARMMNAGAFLSLGCARPPGSYKLQIEEIAIDCGVNAIAYPGEATVKYAGEQGLTGIFTEECCSLAGLDYINNSREG